jgi:hypothetical protein
MNNIIFTLMLCLLCSCSHPVPKPQNLDSQVSDLINSALRPDSQAISFQKLESLGCKAVPFIINHMEDYRQLPRHEIVLRNDAINAFEATRHYGPQLMVDALAAILNQITGRSFEFIYNGGTVEQRKREVERWHLYLNDSAAVASCKDK